MYWDGLGASDGDFVCHTTMVGYVGVLVEHFWERLGIDGTAHRYQTESACCFSSTWTSCLVSFITSFSLLPVFEDVSGLFTSVFVILGSFSLRIHKLGSCLDFHDRDNYG